MPNLETLIRTLRMAIFAALVAWAIAAGAMEYLAPDLDESAAAYPLAPINE
jgi:hypothetical protein